MKTESMVNQLTGKYFSIGCLILILFACQQKAKYTEEEIAQHKKEIDEWHQKRKDYQLSPNGWINVRGLFWLKEGINSFGSGKDNDLVFPEGKIAEKAGYFVLQDSVVTVNLLPSTNVFLVPTIRNSEPVTRLEIFKPDTSKAKILESGSLQWFVIKRSNLIGVRLRDLESEKLTAFKGIENFDTDINWRVKAKIAVPAGKFVDITNVLGQTNHNPVKATLTFSFDNKEYSLDAIDEDGKLFIIFGDQTNGKTTYGSGRYLYAEMPGSGDEVVLDFNRALNPPCAFTEFATCPLPPKQNILPIEVNVGEKEYHY